MRWLGRKFDSFAAALLAAAIGIAMSQALAFSQQYLQRLGGHRDEAERAWQRIDSAIGGGPAADVARRNVAAEAHARFLDLSETYDAIRDAGPFARPLVVFSRLDRDIAEGVVDDFQPAVPVDGASLTYAIGGMLLALLAYDIVKWPFAAIGRRFGRRRSRPRPGAMRL